jgi:tetratricopeptide (TPR) repeat protein
LSDNPQPKSSGIDIPTNVTNISGGVNLDAQHDVNIGGGIVGRDKVVQITNTYFYYNAHALSQTMAVQDRPQPLRVLAVIASPVAGVHGNDPAPISLSGRAEWKSLREATRVAPMLLARLRPPTEAALRSACAPNTRLFNIVHFICHGLPGALALEDERGLTKLIGATELAAALKDGEVELAVVNACYSAVGYTQSIAQALVDAGIRSVVAHRWPLIDPGAVLFTQTLYRELAAGRSLQVAFDQAVQVTTVRYSAEQGNAVIAGDSELVFQRPNGVAPESQVVEGATLPDEAARFLGRGCELLQLADIFASTDLRGAAVTGIGGIGKSTLAFEAADRHAWRFQRVAYVRATELGFKAEDALAELAHGLGLEVRNNVMNDLRDYVNTNPCLLIFDNMERVGNELSRLADFASALNLDVGSKVLFTLRPPLPDRFHDVREVPLVRGLDNEAAIDYVRFIAGNESAAHEWQQPDEARALVERVRGHPEMMRYVVFRSKRVPFTKVKQELAVLSGPLDQRLQDLIGKQVEDAGELAKTVLARLTIFPQTRMIVAAALAASGDASDGLDALVDNGVIALEQGDVQLYAMHSTVVDWAKAHCKTEEADLQEARQRVIDAYARIVQNSDHYIEVLDNDHDNIFALPTWVWNEHTRLALAELMLECDRYLEIRGYWGIARKWATTAVQALRVHADSEQSRRVLATLHFMRAKYQFRQGDPESALRSCHRSRDLNNLLNDSHAQAGILQLTGSIQLALEKTDEALNLFQQSLALYEQMDEDKGKGVLLHAIASVYQDKGRYDEALNLYQQSYDIKWRLGDSVNAVATILAMAQIHGGRGHVNEAINACQCALIICDRIEYLSGKAAALGELGFWLIHVGKMDEAMRSCQESLALKESLADPRNSAYILSNMALIEMSWGNFESAVHLLEHAVELDKRLERRTLQMRETWLKGAKAMLSGNQQQINNAIMDMQRVREDLDKATRSWNL